ncbi:putative Fucose-specific lectin [Seiridium cardinale]
MLVGTGARLGGKQVISAETLRLFRLPRGETTDSTLSENQQRVVYPQGVDRTRLVSGWLGVGYFGGNFFSNPATVSWGPDCLDFIGLDTDNASLRHKYHQDGWSAWEDLGEGHLFAIHVATSWGEGRLDFGAINSDGELNRIYWDGHRYSDW